MMKVLVAADGSANSDRAVEYAVRFAGNSKTPVEIHLLTVHLPIVSGDVKKFVGHEAIDAYYREESEKVLSSSRRILDSAGVRYVPHIGVGQVAETISAYVSSQKCEHLIMGTRGLGSVSGVLLGSVATKVLHLVKVPVILIH